MRAGVTRVSSGRPIWVEPRGLAAGYSWPQFSLHRGQFQMLLLRALQDRAGDVVETGAGIAGFTVYQPLY